MFHDLHYTIHAGSTLFHDLYYTIHAGSTLFHDLHYTIHAGSPLFHLFVSLAQFMVGQLEFSIHALLKSWFETISIPFRTVNSSSTLHSTKHL
jgi:hypothetical protein